jgi:hypothetical protein
LIVVHGIGNQDENQTRDHIVKGLQRAYGPPHFTPEGIRTFPVTAPGTAPSELRLYEAYWAKVLDDDRVRGTFDLPHLQQLIWFPLLNWKHVKNVKDEYPSALVMTWTFVLFMFAGVVTSPIMLAWFIAVMSLPGGVLLGYFKADKLHKEHWRDGFELDRRTAVTEPEETNAQVPRRVYREKGSWLFLLAEVAVLAAIGWAGFLVRSNSLSRSRGWLLIMLLMGAFAIFAGRGITGYWRGILIDERNKMSLSRLQLLVWTLVVLSAIATAAITNGVFGSLDPLAINVPQELWVLLGISSVSAVAAPVLLNQKDDQKPGKDLGKVASELKVTSDVKVDVERSTRIVRNVSPADARWGDLLKGDEAVDALTVDLGKLQMFFFTFVLALGYCVAIAQTFDTTAAMASLPVVDSTVNTLLGISHTGYLASKSMTHGDGDAEEPKPA